MKTAREAYKTQDDDQDDSFIEQTGLNDENKEEEEEENDAWQNRQRRRRYSIRTYIHIHDEHVKQVEFQCFEQRKREKWHKNGNAIDRDIYVQQYGTRRL